MASSDTKTVLAVASGGGHWEQLMLLRPAFDGCDVSYACSNAAQGERFNLSPFYALKDYNQDEPLKVAVGSVETFRLVLKLRPDVIVSTGAAPGLLCLVWGKLFRSKTVWVDSIANSQELSLSGRLALKFADVVVTQWEDLARGESVRYFGSVI